MSKKVYVKPYPKEFREQVVKLVQLGDRSALEVAREFEISVDSVDRRLRMEREILSKAAAWFARETDSIEQIRVEDRLRDLDLWQFNLDKF